MSKKGKKKRPDDGRKVIVRNKKASFSYELIEHFEAGIVLRGSEVKSIRLGRISLGESFAGFQGTELWLHQCHIGEYPWANQHGHDPLRTRKLLLHKRQLAKLAGAVSQDRHAIVPVSVYLTKEGRIKVELALARGKKLYDKRESHKRRSADREIERALRE